MEACFFFKLCVSDYYVHVHYCHIKPFPQIPLTSTCSKGFCRLHIVTADGSFFIALSGSYHTLWRSPPPP